MTKLACAVDDIKTVSPNEVKALLDKDKQGEYLLLDVRQPEEYEDGHIPGATLIPLGEIENRHGELDRSKKIIIYCRSGHRGMAAAIALCGLGFGPIYNMDGGMLNWSYQSLSGASEARPGLITNASSIRDILVLSIKLEKGAWDFYLQARDKADGARETFQMLADAEEAHMQRLYQKAVGLSNKHALPLLEKLKKDQKMDTMEGVIEINAALAKLEEKFVGEMEALEIALEKEYMSYDFYKRAAALVLDSDAKTLLHELAMEERHHSDILLKRLANVVRQK